MLSEDDAEVFFVLNSNPEVLRYTGDNALASVGEAYVFLKNYKDYEQNGYGRWAVVNKNTELVIGWCGLKLNEENLVDLGYRFFRSNWGHGYATEAASACLEYGFRELDIQEIIGRVAEENKASIRILEKLNMRFWKKDECKGIDDSVYYKLSQSEFLENQNRIK